MRNWPAGRLSGVEMIRRTILILMSVTVGLIGSAALASPANALPELYKHNNYSGSYVWAASNYDYSAVPGNTFTDGSALNDQVSSILNWSAYRTCFFVDSGYGGLRLIVPPNTGAKDFGWAYNDNFSSHYTNC